MFGKLIKHEFKATWKVMVLITVLFLAISTAASLFLRFYPYAETITDPQAMMLALAAMSYFIAITVLSTVTVIYLIVHYYRNLYTEQGYLSFTLPASITEVVSSRMVVGVIWTLLQTICLCLAFVLPLSGLLNGLAHYAPDEYDLVFISQNIIDTLKEVGFTNPGMITVKLIVSGLINAISGIMMGFYCISVGQLWQKHKVAGAVLCFFATRVVFGFISSAYALISGEMNIFINDTYTNEMLSAFVNMQIGKSILYSVLAIIFFYVVSIVISNKKLNLD